MKIFRWFLGVLIFGGLFAINLIVDVPLVWRIINPLILCCYICLWRIAKGPDPADRVVSLDILGILIIGFCGIIAVVTGKSYFIDIGIAWALQSFIATLALVKFIEGKGFDE